MKPFNQLGIKPPEQGFIGPQIKMNKILNRQIVVHKYKLEKSKYPEKNEKCLYMQVSVGETMHVIFTGARYLAETIQQVNPEDFPFTTTIVQENDRFEFT